MCSFEYDLLFVVTSLQYIVYCLCKSYAVLIPSLHDLNQLCLLITNYLKSSHLFVRVAALNGLLVLFESCIKTNTTIGSLSEEVLHLRAVIISYISKNIGIADKCVRYISAVSMGLDANRDDLVPFCPFVAYHYTVWSIRFWCGRLISI